MSNEGKIELETKDLLALRREFRELANSMIDNETHDELDRNESKKNMDKWLNRVWENFAGNIVLTDNPDFNFSEPLSIEEPVDETLQFEVKKAENEFQSLTEHLIQQRREIASTIKSFTTESLTLESKAVQQLNIIDDTPVKDKPQVDLVDLKKEVEPDYNDAITLLSKLQNETPHLAREYVTYLDTAKEI